MRRRLLSHDPLAPLRPLGTEEDRRKVRRALRPEEFARLLASCKPHLANLLRFLVGTGCRLDEASTLTWDRVDLEGKTVRVIASVAKNKRARIVPLPGSLVDMLRTLRPADPAGRYVFPTSRGPNFSSASSTLKAFYRAAAKAGIADAEPNGAVDLHALRVTFVTLALDAGADLKGVSEMVGHRQVSTTIGIYDRASEEGKRAAADAVDGLLSGKDLAKPKKSRRKS
jgi:integrase